MATGWAKALLKKHGHTKGDKHYKQTSTIVDGIHFPSKFEASIYQELSLKEKAGKLQNLRLQVCFRLTPSFRWKCDFVVFDPERGCDVAHEAKGALSPRFRIVLKLWKDFGPMPLVVYYQTRQGYLVKEYAGGGVRR